MILDHGSKCKKLSYFASESEKSLIPLSSKMFQSLNKSMARFFLDDAVYNCSVVSDVDAYLCNYAITLLYLQCQNFQFGTLFFLICKKGSPFNLWLRKLKSL